jgi:hypothetical protein
MECHGTSPSICDNNSIKINICSYVTDRFTGSPSSSDFARKTMKSKHMALVCCQPTVNCCMPSATSRNIVHSIQQRQLSNHIKIRNTSQFTTLLKALKMPRRNSVDGLPPCHVHLKSVSTHTLNVSRFWTLSINWRHN